jgi:hypothetical protein
MADGLVEIRHKDGDVVHHHDSGAGALRQAHVHGDSDN